VSAGKVDSLSAVSSNETSQTMSILEANPASVTTFQNKKDKVENNEFVGSGVEIASENALVPTASYLAASNEDELGDSFSDQISVYVVRKGDSLSQIAEMFDVSINTILWANDMKKGEKIKEGDVLFILPISGVKHEVKKGETLKSIAKKYGAELADVADFNSLSENAKLAVGDELIIPGGEIYVDGPSDNPSKVPTKKTPPTPTKNIAGYFINPVLGYIKTQGIHGKNAVDLAAPIGTPIRASASGTVLLARMGWNGAYGNMVIIQHPNGTKTLYSHLSRLGSSTGQNVTQGEVIGYVGNSGRVRASKGGNGAHLHFEVYGAKNPGANGSWAQ
jgi:LysM repeat protein